MGFILLNAMAGIHHPFGENGKGQVDFFLILEFPQIVIEK